MSELIVVGLDALDDARAAMKGLRDLEHAGQVSFEDTAIVERTPDGKIHTHNEVSGTTETGAFVAGMIGALLTFVFPIAGIVVGAAVGGAIGSMLHTGVDGAFVKEVEAKLEPGRSALFLVLKDGSADGIAAALRPYHGELIQTTLDSDLEDELRSALNAKS